MSSFAIPRRRRRRCALSQSTSFSLSDISTPRPDHDTGPRHGRNVQPSSPGLAHRGDGGHEQSRVRKGRTVGVSNSLDWVGCAASPVDLRRNSSLSIEAIPYALTPSLFSKSTSPLGILLDLTRFSLVLDCSDNAPTRYLLSDLCVAANMPLVSGAAIRTEGQVSVWNLPAADEGGQRGPCLRCVFPETGQTAGGRCEDEGVLGPAVGVTGVLMAWGALKLLLGSHGAFVGLPARYAADGDDGRLRASTVAPSFLSNDQASTTTARLSWMWSAGFRAP